MITREEVEEAQKEWGTGLVSIGALSHDRAACEKRTDELIDNLYAYNLGIVLFKPTKVTINQFRLTKQGAKSYFIGGDPTNEEDAGFALMPWIKVRFENVAVILESNRALAMGNYFFTDSEGAETKVEFTFGYQKDSNRRLKIDLHHSSLPYSP